MRFGMKYEEFCAYKENLKKIKVDKESFSRLSERLARFIATSPDSYGLELTLVEAGICHMLVEDYIESHEIDSIYPDEPYRVELLVLSEANDDWGMNDDDSDDDLPFN